MISTLFLLGNANSLNTLYPFKDKNCIEFPHNFFQNNTNINYNSLETIFKVFEIIFSKNHLENINYKMPLGEIIYDFFEMLSEKLYTSCSFYKDYITCQGWYGTISNRYPNKENEWFYNSIIIVPISQCFF